MIQSLISSSVESIQSSRFLAVEGSSGLRNYLPEAVLKIIFAYLSAEEPQVLTRLCGRVKQLAFHSFPEGVELSPLVPEGDNDSVRQIIELPGDRIASPPEDRTIRVLRPNINPLG